MHGFVQESCAMKPEHFIVSGQADARRVSAARFVSQAASAAVILLGLLVLAGWTFNIPALMSVLPRFVTMKVNTAFAFLLIGLSLWLLKKENGGRRTRRIAQACAMVVAVIGLLSLSEYLFGLDLGIDQLLFKEPATATGTSSPGRMAPTTAANFLMLGLVLVLLDVRAVFPVTQLLTLF